MDSLAVTATPAVSRRRIARVRERIAVGQIWLDPALEQAWRCEQAWRADRTALLERNGEHRVVSFATLAAGWLLCEAIR